MIFRKAILVIHGFAGGTFDLEYLANQLELIRNYDVYIFTLPGHDYGLGQARYEDWIKCANEHLEMLIKSGYKSIYLVGHSMGGVIATYLASEHKEVKKLVLAAPAFHYMNFKNDKLDIVKSLRSGIDTLKEYKIEGLIARLVSVPRHALTEFVTLVKKYYDTPKKIKIPILLIQGDKDKVVQESSVDYVYDSVKSKYKSMIIVKGVNHDIFVGSRKEEITKEVIKFFKDRKRVSDVKRVI